MSRIVIANHHGDQVLATFERTDGGSVEIAQEKLTRFLEDCVRQYGAQPPVWARRSGTTEFGLFNGDLTQVDEVLLQFPLIGG